MNVMHLSVCFLFGKIFDSAIRNECAKGVNTLVFSWLLAAARYWMWRPVILVVMKINFSSALKVLFLKNYTLCSSECYYMKVFPNSCF